ncbi:MAG: hypothetical protein ABI615_00525 [Chthoniobacterales bacterium]
MQHSKTNFNEDQEILERLARYYSQKTNYHSAQQTIEQLTRIEPKNPLHWFELSRMAMQNGDTNTAIMSIQKAIAEGGMTYRERIQDEPAFMNLRLNPQFQSLLAIPLRSEPQIQH